MSKNLKAKKIIFNYIPYGQEWEKAVMKMKKKDIIQMLRRVCIKRDELEKLCNFKLLEDV